MNPPVEILQLQQLSKTNSLILQALIAAGGLVGVLLAGWLVDHSGRQLTMVMCGLPFTIGWLLVLITDGITGPLFRPLIFTGRFFIGMGIGIASLSVPVSDVWL